MAALAAYATFRIAGGLCSCAVVDRRGLTTSGISLHRKRLRPLDASTNPRTRRATQPCAVSPRATCKVLGQLAAPRLPHDPNRQAAGRIFGRSASACRLREVRVLAPRRDSSRGAGFDPAMRRLVAASGVLSAYRVEAHVPACGYKSARCRGRRADGVCRARRSPSSDRQTLQPPIRHGADSALRFACPNRRLGGLGP